MAQYVTPYLREGLRSIIDFIDVDSDKWRQYSVKKRWPICWLYGREHRYLLRYERFLAGKFDASVFASEADATFFRTLAPEAAKRVTHINNGVDTAYFSPDERHPNPYTADERVLVFTGTMDYWANVDAVCWFARHVFPTVRNRVPPARFYIVGARPAKTVQNLARQEGVHVTGSVVDVRPYLAHARAVVAPLRVARGVQNKVLEAMAMAKPVIATPSAMAGIKACDAAQQLVANEPAALAAFAIGRLTANDNMRLGETLRQFVLNSYSWSESLSSMERLLEDVARHPINDQSAPANQTC
jgi:sugar transferase (PEP-CTERM/EpsH1 system associated)